MWKGNGRIQKLEMKMAIHMLTESDKETIGNVLNRFHEAHPSPRPLKMYPNGKKEK